MPELGSLLEFRQLCRLEGSLNALLGSDYGNIDDGLLADGVSHHPAGVCDMCFVKSLPVSLEELVLRFCDIDIFDTMEVLLEKRREGGLGRLKKIALIFNREYEADGLEEYEMGELGKACELDAKVLGIHVTRASVSGTG